MRSTGWMHNASSALRPVPGAARTSCGRHGAKHAGDEAPREEPEERAKEARDVAESPSITHTKSRSLRIHCFAAGGIAPLHTRPGPNPPRSEGAAPRSNRLPRKNRKNAFRPAVNMMKFVV